MVKYMFITVGNYVGSSTEPIFKNLSNLHKRKSGPDYAFRKPAALIMGGFQDSKSEVAISYPVTISVYCNLASRGHQGHGSVRNERVIYKVKMPLISSDDSFKWVTGKNN